MYVELSTRNFGGRLSTVAKLRPIFHRWAAIGGPESAQIVVEGSESVTLEALNWLRLPVTIYADSGLPLWWGYVHEVSAQAGAWQIGISLEEMYNKVSVSYTDTAGAAAVTGSVENSTSTAEYGIKEYRHELNQDGATATEAEQLRDRILADYAYPVPQRQRVNGGRTETMLNCRGWWSTLGWQFWSDTGTSNVELTTQISDIIAGAGEFVGAVDIRNTAGINGYEERDGSRTALECIEELLATGTTNDRRLLATVTRDRVLQVYEEPARTEIGYYLERNGRMTRAPLRTRLEEGDCPVGVWAEDAEVLPQSIGLSYLAPISPTFIERNEYRSGELWPEPRGITSAWERFRR